MIFPLIYTINNQKSQEKRKLSKKKNILYPYNSKLDDKD